MMLTKTVTLKIIIKKIFWLFEHICFFFTFEFIWNASCLISSSHTWAVFSEREQETFQTWGVEFCYCSFFPPIPFLQKCSSPLPLPFHLSLPTLSFSIPCLSPSWITQEGKAALIDSHWSFPRSEQKVNGWASSIAVTVGGDTDGMRVPLRFTALFLEWTPHLQFTSTLLPPCFALRSAVYPFQPKAGVWSACPAFQLCGWWSGVLKLNVTPDITAFLYGGIPAVFWACTCSGCQHSRQEPFCSFCLRTAPSHPVLQS